LAKNRGSCQNEVSLLGLAANFFIDCTTQRRPRWLAWQIRLPRTSEHRGW
jgi:hypothetical protein